MIIYVYIIIALIFLSIICYHSYVAWLDRQPQEVKCKHNKHVYKVVVQGGGSWTWNSRFCKYCNKPDPNDDF